MELAFDPGATTGWASSDGYYGELEDRISIWNLLNDLNPTRIIAERFVGGKQFRQEAAQIIGILLLYGDLNLIPVDLKPPPPHSMRPSGCRRHEAVARALLVLYGFKKDLTDIKIPYRDPK